MNIWSKNFPFYKRPLGILRLFKAYYNFFPHFALERLPYNSLPKLKLKSDQLKLIRLRNKYAGKRCFVISNGPSLNNIDINKLRSEVTIGCNGIYKMFSQWGFHTDFLMTEDMEQTELRAKDFKKVNGPIKLAALHNAYALSSKSNFLFFYVGARDATDYWSHYYPRFSKDFASIAYLGSTITYLMLQLAFFLGCNPVYIVGLDFNYGELPKVFPPGKIEITNENFHLIKGLHVSNEYYKVGDVIGVPYVEAQRKAFNLASKVFESNKREIYNATPFSKLESFKRIDYESLF